MLAKLLQERVAKSKSHPMSVGQQGLWHAFRRDPHSTSFNVFLPTRIRAPLNLTAFRAAIEKLVARHACLHSVFTTRNGQLLQVARSEQRPEFSVVEMIGASEDTVRALMANETKRPFDLEQGPLFRVKVYQLAADDWIILGATHHIIVDFWSLVIVMNELPALYSSISHHTQLHLQPAQNNYAQFVREQQQLLASPQAERLRAFWQTQIRDAAPLVELPTDRVRPSVFHNAAINIPLEFSAATFPLMMQVAARCKSTSFAVLQAALQVFVSRYSGQKKFLIGSPFSGRSHQQYESTIGFFINMLPIRADLEGDLTFSQLVARVQETLLSALEHESYPISQIVHDASLVRDSSRSPLFQVSCTLEKSHVASEAGRAAFLFPAERQVRDFAGLQQENFYVPHPTCHYDLEFVLEQSDQRLRGMMVACKALFQTSSLTMMAENFRDLLTSLLSHADSPISRVKWNSETRPISSAQLPQTTTAQTVHAMIEEAANAEPDTIALQFDGQRIRYADLLQLSQRVAARWHQETQRLSRPITDQTIVPICTQNGPLAFIAMLGIHRSGAATVAIDLKQPAIELESLYGDVGANVVLCDSSNTAKSSAARSFIDLNCLLDTEFDAKRTPGVAPQLRPAEATDLAYMVYTSGSTGKPKGVLIDHAAVCNTLAWRRRTVPLQSTDRVLMLLSHQFDAGLGIAWTTLTQGATLVWADEDSLRDPLCLIQQIIRDEITVLPAVPSLLRVLVAQPQFADCRSLRLVFTGGEAMPSELPSRLRQVIDASFWNFYGPSEAAIEASACEVTHHSPQRIVPIGIPVSHTDILVLDEHQQIVPTTVPGELAIAGAGLARGYWQDPELTDQKFIVLPEDSVQPPRRVYLTGDRGRRLPNGELEFLGRIDHQIKLRGYRIELGEIEAVLESHPQVERAAVKLSQAGTPQEQLLAFVSLKSSDDQESMERLLRRYASERLPSYKTPAGISVVQAMPLTSSGKVDRRQLPDSLPTAYPEKHFIAPATKLEETVAAAWCATLGIESVSTDVNFFDAGGSSLQAAMLTTQLSQDLGVHVPTSLLFDLADVTQVATRLAQLHPSAVAEKFGQPCVDEQLARAEWLGTQAGTRTTVHPLLAPLKVTGGRPPIFMVHPPGGIVVCYRELAQHLDAELPLVAIRARGLHGQEELPATLVAMAADYVSAMRTYQPVGPYTLGGWSLGGLIAYEMAQQLLNAGQSVAQLILLDTTIPEGSTSLVPSAELVNVGLEYGIELTLEQLGDLSPEEQLPFLWDHAKGLGVLDEEASPEIVAKILEDLQRLFHHHVDLARVYQIEPLAAKILLCRPTEIPFALKVSPDRGWRFLAQTVGVHQVPGHHHSMVQPPHVQQLAQVLNANL